MCISAVEYYSFRNVENGSWFIQSLCDVFIAAARKPEAYDKGSDLLRLLTAVNRKVAYEYQSLAKVEVLNQMKEMPNFLSTLTKTFYLKVKSHPGKWVIEIVQHTPFFGTQFGEVRALVYICMTTNFYITGKTNRFFIIAFIDI